MIALVKPSQPRRPARRKPQVIVKENLPCMVDDWIRHLKIDHEQDTLTGYRAALRNFEQWAREEKVPLHVETIQKEHIQSYIAWLAENKKARATIRVRHAALKSFWDWLVEENEADKNVAKQVRSVRKRAADTERLPQVLTDVALARILRACSGRDFNSRRDMAMIRVLLDSGIRRAELANMRLDKVDIDEQEFETRGDNNKRGPRRLPFNLHTADALATYIRARRDHNYADSPMLWLGQMGPLTRMGCYQALKRRARKAGIPDAHTHLFRHTWAHKYKEAGGSLENIMALGGWKSMEVVKVYGRSEAHKRAMDDYKRRGLGDRV